MSNKILLIDTSALVYRSYHAIPPLTNQAGEVVNAVYGVATTLLSVIKELEPTAVIAAFDVKKPTFRHKMFDGYKATRKKTPDDLVTQLPYIRQLINTLGISAVSKDGFEADDVIGTLARKITTDHPDIEVIIVTGDNDALGLVNDQIKVRTFGRGIKDVKIYDTEAVRAKYGLEPTQLADYKGLAGDSSDNIPGVTGVGAIGATKLLQKYQNLENIYEHIDEITGAIGAKLARDHEQALLSKKLGTIDTAVPIDEFYDNLSFLGNKEASKFEINAQSAQKFFGKMGFFSLIKRLNNSDNTNSDKSKSAQKTKEVQYTISNTKQEIDNLRKLIVQNKLPTAFWIVVDEVNMQINGISFSVNARSATFIPFNEQTKPQIAQIFDAGKGGLITYNSKQALKLLHGINIKCAGIGSVLLESYLLEAGTKHSLERATQMILDEQLPPIAQTQLSLLGEASIDQTALANSANTHADYIGQIHANQIAQIAKLSETKSPDTNCPPVNIGNKDMTSSNWNLQTVLTEMELPLVPIISAMELWGISFDKEQFVAASREIAQKLKQLEVEIYQDADCSFNIKSPKQLAVILFENLQLSTKGIKKTKTGYSTAADELDKLRKLHPIIDKISTYRELSKLKSTYIDVLPKLVGDDGRIHSQFHQTVTATGRLSSSDPNLQNIPTRGDYARTIRSAFVAAPGYTLISADYSQIDLRCVAHIACDEAMIAAFVAGEDIHSATAAAINGVPLSEVTKEMRFAAKELNFGLIYGMGAYGFARSAGIDAVEASKFIEAYFTKFTGVARYMEEIVISAKENGFVATPFGRRRSTAEINSPNAQIAKSGQRMAINMPIQGFASDIMKLAMIAVSDEYNLTHFAQNPTTDNSPVRIVLQIHDEIILEVRENIAPEVAQKVKNIMENVTTLRVPLLVETTTSPNWAGLK